MFKVLEILEKTDSPDTPAEILENKLFVAYSEAYTLFAKAETTEQIRSSGFKTKFWLINALLMEAKKQLPPSDLLTINLRTYKAIVHILKFVQECIIKNANTCGYGSFLASRALSLVDTLEGCQLLDENNQPIEVLLVLKKSVKIEIFYFVVLKGSLLGSCWLWKLPTDPTEEDEYAFDSNRYILTDTCFFYYDYLKHSLHKIELEKLQLAQLHNNFLEFERGSKLSSNQLHQITAITAHTSLDHQYVEAYLNKFRNKYIRSNSKQSAANLYHYFSLRALLYARKGEDQRSEDILKRAEYYFQKKIKENEYGDHIICAAYRIISSSFYQQENFSRCLYYADLEKACRQDMITMGKVLLSESNNFNMKDWYRNQAILPMLPLISSIIQTEEEAIQIYLNPLINRCKIFLFKERVDEIGKIANLITVVSQDTSQFQITVGVAPSCNINLLGRLCARNGIKYKLENDQFVFKHVYKLNTRDLKDAIISYKQEMKKKLFQKKEIESIAVATIDEENQQEDLKHNNDANNNNAIIPSCTSYILNKKNKSDSKIKYNDEGNNNNVVVPKIIQFSDKLFYVKNGSSTVFKLHGNFAKRQYVYLKKDILRDLSEKVKRNIYQMCERGKVLGCSYGEKGFLIKGEKIRTKDSSKDYSFWGSLEKKILLDQKEHTLFVLDTFCPSHKHR